MLVVPRDLEILGSGREGSFAAGIATVVGIIDSGMLELDVRGVPYSQLAFTRQSMLCKVSSQPTRVFLFDARFSRYSDSRLVQLLYELHAE